VISRSGQEAGSQGTEEGLEQKDCGYLVDDGSSFLTATPGAAGRTRAVQYRVSIGGGEAFINEVKVEGWVLLAQRIGKVLYLDRLRAEFTRGVERETDDDDGNGVLADKAGNRFQVNAQIGAVQGEKRLRCVAERIRQGKADATISYI